MDTAIVNMSGRKFEISLATLTRGGVVALSGLNINHPAYRVKYNDYFFERHIGCFKAVLYYLQSGDLHIPSEVCMPLFLREMKYWGLRVDCLNSCCYVKYADYQEERRIEAQLKIGEDKPEFLLKHADGFRRFKIMLWDFLDNPTSSRPARIFSCISVAMVALSIFALFAATDTSFKVQMTKMQWEDYLGDEYKLYDFSDFMSQDLMLNSSDYDYQDEQDTDHPGRRPPRPRPLPTTTKLPLPEGVMAKKSYLSIIDYMCMCFFTVELLLRILACPNKCAFFMSALTIIDIVTLLPMYAIEIIERIVPKEAYASSVWDYVLQVEILRIFRIVRLTRHMIGVRALFFSMKKSLVELLLLTLFVMFGSIFYASLIYIVDDRRIFPSLPISLWWAVVTMTTLGYGDIVPQNLMGKIVGSLCAISGIALMAAMVPIFVKNFQMYYTCCKAPLQTKEKWNMCDKEENVRRKSSVLKMKVWPVRN